MTHVGQPFGANMLPWKRTPLCSSVRRAVVASDNSASCVHPQRPDEKVNLSRSKAKRDQGLNRSPTRLRYSLMGDDILRASEAVHETRRHSSVRV